MSWWNSWGDTAQRLFVPFGGSVDNSNAPWWDLGGQIQKSADQSDAAERQRKQLLYGQAAQAGNFADRSQASYRHLGTQGQSALDALQAQTNGQNSVSALQLQQGLQQNLAAQRAMAAGASPQNSAMAARTAAIQSGRLGAGLAGQQAVAGLQERNQAQSQYANLLQGLRQQDLNATLGSRNTAVQGYGAQDSGSPDKSAIERYGPAAAGIASLIFSDRRLKTDIKDGDEAADSALKGLRAYFFRYKDEKHGEGARPGVMAQDLEKAGLGHAVVETPRGKMVHGGHLATALAAMLPGIDKRISALEGAK